MTPSIVLANLALSVASLAALCLSMGRHHVAAFLVKPSLTEARALRAAGWAGITLSFAVAVMTEGWNFGSVQAIGALSGAGLIVVVLAAYRPGWVRPAALLSLPLALVAPFML